MAEIKKKNKNQIPLADRTPLKLKDEPIIKDRGLLGFNNLNNQLLKKSKPSNNFNIKKYYQSKESSNSLKNSINYSKEQTKSREIDKRCDMFGNFIVHGGKQKISFIDQVSKNSLFEIIKIESYKEYNKIEEVAPTNGNSCCLII